MTKLFLVVLLITSFAAAQSKKESDPELNATIDAYYDKSRVEFALAELTIKQATDTLINKLKQ